MDWIAKLMFKLGWVRLDYHLSVVEQLTKDRDVHNPQDNTDEEGYDLFV